MLSLDALKYLDDIVRACEKLKRFTSGILLADYLADEMRRSAVERQFEVIGEAMAQLLKCHPEMQANFSDHRRIIAFRNRLIHGYAAIDDEVVWGILSKDLSVLHREAAALLDRRE